MKIGYCRATAQNQNLEPAIAALRDSGCERIYNDTGVGANCARPGMADLLEHVKPGDLVVVLRLDALAVCLADLLATTATLAARGVDLYSMAEQILTDRACSAYHVFTAIEGFERNVKNERALAGLAAARDQNRLGGRKPVLDDDKKKTVKTMLAEAKRKGVDPDFESIGRSVGASGKTIRRFASRKGVYSTV